MSLDFDALSLAAVQDEEALLVLLDALEESGQPPPSYVRKLDEVFFSTVVDYRRRVQEHRKRFALDLACERVRGLFSAHWSTKPWRGDPRGLLRLKPEGGIGTEHIAGWPIIRLASRERIDLIVVADRTIEPCRIIASDDERELFFIHAISTMNSAKEESLDGQVMAVMIENATDAAIELHLALRYRVWTS